MTIDPRRRASTVLPGEDDPRRAAIRAWLSEHPDPSPRDLAEAGYVAPHWPRPWGLNATALEQAVIAEELERARVELPDNPIAIGWAGPTIVHGGTDAQQRAHLPRILAGEEAWCQLFSEPEAGSDLADLSTRAVRDGDRYVINGQKIWSSWAERSEFGLLLARTDPDAPKHRGISYFICPMDSPGIDIRPITDMTGGSHFNEVFLTDVVLPAENLIGEENQGWTLAKITLMNERLSLSTGGVLWGMGPTTADFLELVRERGGVDDPLLRQRVADVALGAEVIRLLGERMLAALARGDTPGSEASIKKLRADEHGQTVMRLAKDLTGYAGLLDDRGPLGADVGEWHWGYLFSRSLTIGGGTGEIQRNIIAERVLGLPSEPDPGLGQTWAEGRRARGR